MPKKESGKPGARDANVIEQNIVNTLETNYMPYVMSVIVSRAIPEIDGFKPAHRKLLYTMYKMGLLTGGRVKSADVVGQTMRLNPHGELAIYETLVRLTRGNGALLHPFIDSKGNFGKAYSRDMAFAASRYTEVKLDSICAELFGDIDKDTVDMIDNYNSTTKEPALFPASFPNLLVTPNQGIAVGMASSVCSFNLKEVCHAAMQYIKNSGCDLMEYMPAPDFSTGGQLLYDRNEMAAIYEQGRGSFKLRARYRHDRKNSCIEITEIPYTATIEMIIDRIAQLVKGGRLKEINDVRDETDLNGLKITIDIKKSCDPHLLMRRLYQTTPLCDSYNCNFNFLIDGKPKVMGIREILGEWLLHRVVTVKRRTAFQTNKVREKLHLLEGLSKILLNIDKAVKIIRNTEKEADVVPNLMKGFSIDEVQAEYISDIRLRNLNREYLLNRTGEADELKRELAGLLETLGSEDKIKEIIIEELKAVIKKYGKPRMTEIVAGESEAAEPEETFVEDYGLKLFLTERNYLKKIPNASLRMAGEHQLKDGDAIAQEIEATNKSDVLFFSDRKNVYKLKAYELPDCKTANLGEFLTNTLALEEGERIVRIAATNDYSGYMLLGFANGKIAKVTMESYATKTNRKKLINGCSEKSELLFAHTADGDMDIFLERSDGKAMLVNTALLSPVSAKNSPGVQVFRMNKNCRVTGLFPSASYESEDPEYYRSDAIPSAGHFKI